MTEWASILKRHEHEFFPERFDAPMLVDSMRDETMPPATRDMIADELLARAGFDVDAAITRLQAEWWGDDPTGCRRAWEALERAKERP